MCSHLPPSHDFHVQLVPPGVWPGVICAVSAIGPTRNVDDWYAAFGVKAGDAYYLAPDQRVHIW